MSIRIRANYHSRGGVDDDFGFCLFGVIFDGQFLLLTFFSGL